MSIITIFSASYCKENEIVIGLAEKTGYEILDKQLIEETSNIYNVSAKKIKSTLEGQVSFFNNITHDREKNTAYLQSTLAELAKKDNIIYSGYACHLLPSDISHILKVCLVANQDFRINNAQQQDNLSEKDAKNKIKKDNEYRINWVQYLLDKSPWDESIYDIVIPIHSTSVEEAINLILKNVEKNVIQTTPESQKALENFSLEAKINIPLVENGYNVYIKNNEGKITISLKEYVIRLENEKEKIINLISPVEGVNHVEVIMGPEAKIPSRYDELKASPRYLLVDDEKEYVQTLSQRLQVRDLPSAIAYDGEEALNYLQKDEPDVMVLDLKMPGINGMDVLRKVKKDRPRVEVIILTGHGSEKDKELAMELGAFAYLEKPVEIDVLTKTMKEAYDKINKNKSNGNG
jgi:CheY-like chemotaxis protein